MHSLAVALGFTVPPCGMTECLYGLWAEQVMCAVCKLYVKIVPVLTSLPGSKNYSRGVQLCAIAAKLSSSWTGIPKPLRKHLVANLNVPHMQVKWWGWNESLSFSAGTRTCCGFNWGRDINLPCTFFLLNRDTHLLWLQEEKERGWTWRGARRWRMVRALGSRPLRFLLPQLQK